MTGDTAVAIFSAALITVSAGVVVMRLLWLLRRERATEMTQIKVTVCDKCGTQTNEKIQSGWVSLTITPVFLLSPSPVDYKQDFCPMCADQIRKILGIKEGRPVDRGYKGFDRKSWTST